MIRTAIGSLSDVNVTRFQVAEACRVLYASTGIIPTEIQYYDLESGEVVTTTVEEVLGAPFDPNRPRRYSED